MSLDLVWIIGLIFVLFVGACGVLLIYKPELIEKMLK